MTKEKTREDLTRTDLAARLRALADQLDGGRVTLDGAEVAVPEQVRLKVELDDDEIEMKVRWRVD